jgi:hypothetical protein
MTNKEAIDRWSEQIIPAVFKAEQALQQAVPEWKERLKNVTEETGPQVSRKYCQAIAHIIVTHGIDYVPDGSIDGEADFT